MAGWPDLWREVLNCCVNGGASEEARRLVIAQLKAAERQTPVLFALASDDERGLSVWVGDPDDPVLYWAPRADVLRCIVLCVERPSLPVRVDHLHGGDPDRLMRGVRRRIDNALQGMPSAALVERLQEGLDLRQAGPAVWLQYAGRPIRTDYRGTTEGPARDMRGTFPDAHAVAQENHAHQPLGGFDERIAGVGPNP